MIPENILKQIYAKTKEYGKENSPQQVSIPAFNDGAFFGYSLRDDEVEQLKDNIEHRDFEYEILQKEVERVKGLVSYAHQHGYAGGQTGNNTIEKSWQSFKQNNNL